MADITKKQCSCFKLQLFFIISVLFTAAIFHIQGLAAGSRRTSFPLSSMEMKVQRTFSANQETKFQNSDEGRKIKIKEKRKRLMIGSVAPTCTYNECRGCKYKCRAEQVPVEGNDPINSPYHYKCVCHSAYSSSSSNFIHSSR